MTSFTAWIWNTEKFYRMGRQRQEMFFSSFFAGLTSSFLSKMYVASFCEIIVYYNHELHLDDVECIYFLDVMVHMLCVDILLHYISILFFIS